MSNTNLLTPSPAALAAQAAAAQNPHLRKIRDLIYKVAGILQPDHKLQFLEDRCGRRMQQLKVTSLHAYYDCLTMSSVRDEEMKELLNEITIGETCFFRNGPQLDALRSVVLPAMLKNKSHLAYRHLRLWSAGCSTGEEAYTLAILLLQEHEGALKNVNVEVLATDLNLRSLEAAQAGVPVVANRLPVLEEVLCVDGEPCALFADVGDPAAFAAAVRRLIDDAPLAATLTARGAKLAARYSLAAMVDAYGAAIEFDLKRRSNRGPGRVPALRSSAP